MFIFLFLWFVESYTFDKPTLLSSISLKQESKCPQHDVSL